MIIGIPGVVGQGEIWAGWFHLMERVPGKVTGRVGESPS